MAGKEKSINNRPPFLPEKDTARGPQLPHATVSSLCTRPRGSSSLPQRVPPCLSLPSSRKISSLETWLVGLCCLSALTWISGSRSADQAAGPSVDFSSQVPVLLWVFCLVTMGAYEQDFVVPLERSFRSLSKQPVPTPIAAGKFLVALLYKMLFVSEDIRFVSAAFTCYC